MSITKDNRDELVAECTECGAEEYGGVLDFKEFVSMLENMGWKVTKEDGEWCHYCPDCV